MTKSVYVPVCVDIDDEGNAVSAYIEWEGAPWMYVDKEPNVFNDDSGDWESGYIDGDNADIVEGAEAFLAERLVLVKSGDIWGVQA